MDIQLHIPEVDIKDTARYQEILVSLISSGALNLKNGKATLHFDSEGTYQGVQLDYWAWKRKKS
jgi:hypothetical protein